MEQSLFSLALSILPALAMSSCCVPANHTKYKLLEDDLGYDSKLEICHLFYNQWPLGIAVSRCGRKFAAFPGGPDIANANDGCNGAYQLAELKGDKEIPYPDVATNNPPGGAVDYTKCPPVTKGLSNYFLGVTRVFIDDNNNLWALDTGRVRGKCQMIYNSSPCGPKLVGIDLCRDRIFRTYVLPRSVVKPSSYLTDVYVDTKHNKAYICDALEYAIIVVDLCTGDSWKVLHQHPSVLDVPGALPFVWGTPSYDTFEYPDGKTVVGSVKFGIAALTLSSDAQKLYYTQMDGRVLYSVNTALLQSPCTLACAVASSVENHGEKGVSAGLACDPSGNVWSGNAEQDAISVYNPCSRKTTLYIRDKRINWAYAFSIPNDGYVYFLVNQFNNAGFVYPGTGPLFKDRRKRPYVLFRFKLPDPCCCKRQSQVR